MVSRVVIGRSKVVVVVVVGVGGRWVVVRGCGVWVVLVG